VALFDRFPRPRVAEDLRPAFARDLVMTGGRSIIFTLLFSVGPQLVQELGGGSAHVAALRTSSATGLLLSLVWVALGRGRSPLQMILVPGMLARLLLCAVAFVGMAEGPFSPATLVTIILFLSHSLLGLTVPFISTIYGLVYPAHERARLVALGRMVSGLVSVAAATGLGALFAADHTAYRWVYPAAGLFGAVTIAWFSTMPVDDARAKEAPGRKSAWAVLRENPAFRRFQLFQFVLGLANLSVHPLIDLYVRRVLHMSIEEAVWVVSGGVVGQIATLFTVQAQARLFNRIGVVWHRVLTSSLLGLGLICWAFAHSAWVAVLAATLTGLGMAGGQIIWIIGSVEFAPREDISTYNGIHTFLTGLRGVIAPTIGVSALALVADGEYRPVFLCSAALVFASALGHAMLVRPPREEHRRARK
jgi:MFS family permease